MVRSGGSSHHHRQNHRTSRFQNSWNPSERQTNLQFIGDRYANGFDTSSSTIPCPYDKNGFTIENLGWVFCSTQHRLPGVNGFRKDKRLHAERGFNSNCKIDQVSSTSGSSSVRSTSGNSAVSFECVFFTAPEEFDLCTRCWNGEDNGSCIYAYRNF